MNTHQETTPAKGVILWIHLAKTGGTALAYHLEKSYKNKFLHYWTNPGPEKVKEDLRTPRKIIGGHLTYGFHTWVPGPCSYMTVLRHPVARTWSHYQYHLHRKTDPNHALAAGKDLQEWLETTEFGKNAMTAYLSGAMPNAWWSPENCEKLPPRVNGKPNPAYEVTETHYKQAKAHLDRFGFVGILEREDITARRLKAFLNLRRFRVTRRNVGPSVRGPTEQEAALILQYNEWDMRLHTSVLKTRYPRL